MNPPGLSLLTFNIGNPSSERAQRQLAWLASRDEQVLVLTEKASAGCKLLADAFADAGYLTWQPRKDWPWATRQPPASQTRSSRGSCARRTFLSRFITEPSRPVRRAALSA